MGLALEQDSARSGTLGVGDYEIPKKRQGLWIIGEFFFCGGRGASENYTGRVDFESLLGLLARVLAIAVKI